MSDFVTDTHGIIWYFEADQRLGPQASAAYEACDNGDALIYVPTICLVELVYLQEKGRVPATLYTRFGAALKAGTSGFIVADLTLGVVETLAKIPKTSVPDMPDRIIAATALHLDLPLITRDKEIRLSSVVSIW